MRMSDWSSDVCSSDRAENEFWRWMASWAVMLRKPSDLGYPNAGYDLPPLHYHQHVVGVEYAPSIETGLLFPMQAATLAERRSEERRVGKECDRRFDTRWSPFN